MLETLDGVHATLEKSNQLQFVLLGVFHAGYLPSLETRGRNNKKYFYLTVGIQSNFLLISKRYKKYKI